MSIASSAELSEQELIEKQQNTITKKQITRIIDKQFDSNIFLKPDFN